ncbi:MAG: hypothetical protein ACOCV1_07550, partial [Bacillota bacterium]
DFKIYESRELAKRIFFSNSIQSKNKDSNKMIAFINRYHKINTIRQSVAHGSLTKNQRMSKHDIDNYVKYQTEIEDLLNNFQLKKEINKINIEELKELYEKRFNKPYKLN